MDNVRAQDEEETAAACLCCSFTDGANALVLRWDVRPSRLLLDIRLRNSEPDHGRSQLCLLFTTTMQAVHLEECKYKTSVERRELHLKYLWTRHTESIPQKRPFT
mmetsp:Transcript_2802/g.8534  ORF Transcript_2802/g.8534 Transcript_2802/m.8534 type:complete len:105 (-) Transcript_2802:613-927(-)